METYTLSTLQIEEMTAQYLETLLWCQIDTTGHGHCEQCADFEYEALDANYDLEDVADEYVDAVRDGFKVFCEAYGDDVRAYLEIRTESDFAHDLYLTREHHGAGFWDRGLGDLGDRLTDAADDEGSANPLFDARWSVPGAAHHGERVLIGESPGGW